MAEKRDNGTHMVYCLIIPFAYGESRRDFILSYFFGVAYDHAVFPHFSSRLAIVESCKFLSHEADFSNKHLGADLLMSTQFGVPNWYLDF